jgi:glycosyltransferase involved in cell wall biosynthesis
VRIAVDTSVLRRPHTGIARWVTGLTTALAASGRHDVRLAPGPGRLGRGGALYRIPNLLRQRWWYAVGLPRQAWAAGADVILGPANFAARRSAIAQVVTIHDANFLQAPGTYEPAVVEYLTRVVRHAAANADALTTPSEHSRRNLIDHFGVRPEAISVVYPGVEPPPRALESRAPHPRPYALYVGATEFHKNLDTLLRAWRPDPPEDLDLVLVGQPGRAHATLLAEAARRGGSVIVRGAVDQAELERWYGHAAVFLFPSLAEGFGYPPLEAMQRGVPVIAARAGALPEVLDDAAMLHEPWDADEVRSLVTAVVTDGELRARLIEIGRSRAEGFTWDRAVAGMDAAIERALATRH